MTLENNFQFEWIVGNTVSSCGFQDKCLLKSPDFCMPTLPKTVWYLQLCTQTLECYLYRKKHGPQIMFIDCCISIYTSDGKEIAKKDCPNVPMKMFPYLKFNFNAELSFPIKLVCCIVGVNFQMEKNVSCGASTHLQLGNFTKDVVFENFPKPFHVYTMKVTPPKLLNEHLQFDKSPNRQWLITLSPHQDSLYIEFGNYWNECLIVSCMAALLDKKGQTMWNTYQHSSECTEQFRFDDFFKGQLLLEDMLNPIFDGSLTLSFQFRFVIPLNSSSSSFVFINNNFNEFLVNQLVQTDDPMLVTEICQTDEKSTVSMVCQTNDLKIVNFENLQEVMVQTDKTTFISISSQTNDLEAGKGKDLIEIAIQTDKNICSTISKICQTNDLNIVNVQNLVEAAIQTEKSVSISQVCQTDDNKFVDFDNLMEIAIQTEKLIEPMQDKSIQVNMPNNTDLEDYDFTFCNAEVSVEQEGSLHDSNDFTMNTETCEYHTECLNQTNKKSSLNLDFKSFISKRSLPTDSNLKIGSKLFPVDKCILSARSSYFADLYFGKTAKQQDNIIELNDINANTLHQFLEFMYTDKIEIADWQNALNLHFVAVKFQVLCLTELCIHFLKSNLSVLNVCPILKLADASGDQLLKCNIQYFFLKYEEDIMLSEEWRNFIETDPFIAAKSMHAFQLQKILQKNKY